MTAVFTSCERGVSSGRLAEYFRASVAEDNGLGVSLKTEGGDLVATGPLDIRRTASCKMIRSG